MSIVSSHDVSDTHMTIQEINRQEIDQNKNIKNKYIITYGV